MSHVLADDGLDIRCVLKTRLCLMIRLELLCAGYLCQKLCVKTNAWGLELRDVEACAHDGFQVGQPDLRFSVVPCTEHSTRVSHHELVV